MAHDPYYILKLFPALPPAQAQLKGNMAGLLFKDLVLGDEISNNRHQRHGGDDGD